MQGLRQELVQDARVARGPIGDDFERHRAYLERLDEERPRGCEIPLDAQHYIHDLAMLVDGSVEVAPPSGDLDVVGPRRDGGSLTPLSAPAQRP